MPRLGLLVGICLALLAVAAPVSAHATLVFTREPPNEAFDSAVVWVAEDDGSGARPLVPGYMPSVSPDGSSIAYLESRDGQVPMLMVVATEGNPTPRGLVPAWRQPFIRWSPDSTTVAVVSGPERGRKSLVTINLASGAQRTIARGYFDGVSFDPDGGRLIYSRSSSDAFPPHSDIYVASLAGGHPVRLTHDRRSLAPLWGPNGTIVFSRQLKSRKPRGVPKRDLFLMDPNGRRVRRLTHTKHVGNLQWGLTAVQWSADGRRLLTNFEGQATLYGVAVNPRTGAERDLSAHPYGYGFVADALSADGKTILGEDSHSQSSVVTIPYSGGPERRLVGDARFPDWNR